MPVRRPEQRVAILFSEHDEPERYVISKLADHWRADGLHVEYLRGTGRYVPADVLMLHVDLSVMPRQVSSFARRYRCVINQHVRDIRKRTYSALIVDRNSGYTGPVIVKTDLNFGGGPESGRHPNRALRVYYRARRVYFRVVTGGWGYRIYESAEQVPALVWRDPYMIVEKFVPERQGDDFVVRTYHCFGERESFFLLTSPDPIVKSGPITRLEPLPPDPRLRAIRRQLKLDYGKLDYILVDGEPVVLDLNKTIGLTDHSVNDPCLEHDRRERAAGIYDFLP